MASDAETQATLDALRRIGVPLALDDFGTGYSSLSHLARMRADLLKLDREFLAGIDETPAQARLVGGVIQLARTLGVPVIAEGIERPAQLERLLELGGHLGQGYLLGVPAEAHVLAGAARRLAPAAHRRAAGTTRTVTRAGRVRLAQREELAHRSRRERRTGSRPTRPARAGRGRARPGRRRPGRRACRSPARRHRPPGAPPRRPRR